MLLTLLLACSGGDAHRFRALVADEGGDYALEVRSIDTLRDPERLAGDLGQGWSGGVLDVNLSEGTIHYEKGRPLSVLYVVQDGVAEPLDRDGLTLFSFYGHLQDARDALDRSGVDISPLFPIQFGVTPAVSDPSFVFAPVENAAYAPTANSFILLEDVSAREVPLAANAGVVSHELGHGVFHLLTAGGPYRDRAFDVLSHAAPGVSSLDEGFGDMLGSLITDDPDFISASWDLPERDVSAEHLSSQIDTLPEEFIASGSALGYDPYPLGTVFASVMWDVRQATADPDGTLLLACSAVEEWAARETASGDEDVETAYRWLDVMVELADADQRAAACESIDRRFADHVANHHLIPDAAPRGNRVGHMIFQRVGCRHDRRQAALRLRAVGVDRAGFSHHDDLPVLRHLDARPQPGNP